MRRAQRRGDGEPIRGSGSTRPNDARGSCSSKRSRLPKGGATGPESCDLTVVPDPDFKTGRRWIAGALIAGLSIGILWSFLKVPLWAAIIAVATWPLYRRFARYMPSSMASNVTPLLFTVLIALVVLGPPVSPLEPWRRTRALGPTPCCGFERIRRTGLAVHRARGWAQSGRAIPHSWRTVGLGSACRYGGGSPMVAAGG